MRKRERTEKRKKHFLFLHNRCERTRNELILTSLNARTFNHAVSVLDTDVIFLMTTINSVVQRRKIVNDYILT
jgi:hypothetical protein